MEVKAISCRQYIKGIDLSRNVSEKWEEIVGLEHHAAGMKAYEHAMQVHCSEGSARQGNPAEEKNLYLYWEATCNKEGVASLQVFL